MRTLGSWKNVGAFLLFCAAAAISSPAQTFTTLKAFDITDGALPQGTLVQGLDGNFYGTTVQGGRQAGCDGGCGTVFKITPGGTLTTLHEFVGADGSYPHAGLVLATDGNFYGSAPGGSDGGAISTAFEITPSGTLTILNSSFGFGVQTQDTSLVQDTVNGDFYGIQGNIYGMDTNIFEMSPSGSVNTLYSFCTINTQCPVANGANATGALVWDVYDGLFYGVTRFGGITKGGLASACSTEGGCGTIFEIGTGGHLKPLYRFTGESDGAFPVGGLAQGTDGNFYGTATFGGGAFDGGVVFKISPTGTFTTLYKFCPTKSCVDGVFPVSRLVQATDGNFYGTTYYGGLGDCSGQGCGTVFKITPDGTFTSIYSFCLGGFPCSDGMYPIDGLVQGTDGNLYGTTTGKDGKSYSQGTVFKISLGLAPFVKTLQLGAHTGTEVTILGTGLTGASSVSFNGASASFTVVSATEIRATVPAGATTGPIEVTTPSGTLQSNVAFRVYL